ncbi:PTS fructose transporter subunit IIB [[Clostridium] innocuum]|uniref:PTS fructose transporter subunit IIB n=1 Tax=Clostridium innocuum TaxID=1522 RepID=UPI0021498BF0|nr:PTS fructose transporter subunit IIB [[Clostridium] innocuum]MCR0273993.1 PTS fructose transporter subunit IIB [[Clostridium] innocuum]
MKIVGVCACTVGIAHTYIAQEKLEKAAKKAGFEAKFETQGSIGKENELTQEDIAYADVVLLAIDVKITDRERFEGKKVVQVSTDVAIKSPNKLMEKVKQIVVKG